MGPGTSLSRLLRITLGALNILCPPMLPLLTMSGGVSSSKEP